LQLPSALLTSLQGIKGFNQAAFEAIHTSGEQVTSIRINPLKIVDGQWSKVDSKPISWCPYGYYLPERPFFTFDPTFHAGAYYVQEASSMFLWQILTQAIGTNTNGLKVLDLCAAPGGKSTLLASYFKDGLVVSNDVIKSRANILVENITKWGYDNVVVTNNDPSHFKMLENYFDVIVIDAPCSGSGLFRRDNDAINEWSENNVALCSQRQQRILADVLPALKQGGLLIYSTCSYSKQEDEDIVDWLIEEQQLSTVNCQPSTNEGIIETQSDKHQGFGYRFYPYLTKGEGFFAAAFTKNNGGLFGNYKEQTLAKPSKQEEQMVVDFIGQKSDYSFFKQAEAIRLLPTKWWLDLQILAKCLYIKKAGIEIGTIKGKDVIPHHELAVSILDLPQINTVELTEEEALQYLRRKDLTVQTTKGWCAPTHCGLRLGWMKVLPNRINNYYPQEWRILKE
jgi:16S rRNA C967 or C1407 C5-methylase (RsmB/RsmF family)/NOL1/NOP2/fmu family ribosome biogenesis protein